jgi:uncharacterized membrane protein
MTLAKTAFAVVLIAYPLIVYFGLGYFETRWVALTVMLVAISRFFLIKRIGGANAYLPQGNLVVGALLLVGFTALAANSSILLQYYPVCINALMFGFFFLSIFRPPSVIEQFARVKTPELPDEAISYTRKVTMVWSAFFVLNGSMALYTILNTDIRFWAIYNGAISYSLMGALFAGEYVVRRRVQRGVNRGAAGWG